MVGTQPKRLVWGSASDRTTMGTFAVPIQAITDSLQISTRARCQAKPLRSDREKCLLLTSPFIEPAHPVSAPCENRGCYETRVSRFDTTRCCALSVTKTLYATKALSFVTASNRAECGTHIEESQTETTLRQRMRH